MLATIAANTKRVNRRLSLVEVGEMLESAIRRLGGVPAAAERLGLSPEMIREFRAVRTLDPAVRELVASRQIDSVDVAYRLSKLKPEDQRFVAKAFLAKKVSSKDVREVVTHRLEHSHLSIQDALDRIVESRPKHLYLIRVPDPGTRQSRSSLEKRFHRLLGEQGVHSIAAESGTLTIKLTAEGKRALDTIARQRRLTKRLLVTSVLQPQGVNE